MQLLNLLLNLKFDGHNAGIEEELSFLYGCKITRSVLLRIKTLIIKHYNKFDYQDFQLLIGEE